MSVRVNQTDKRGPKAIAIVLADEWKRFVDRSGRVSFSIPSASHPGRYYRVSDNGCTCMDLQRRPWIGACKHMLAVRLQLDLDEEAYAF